MTKNKYVNQSETNRVFSVFQTFNKDSDKIKSQLAQTESSERVVTFSSLGNLGRFGNQLLQYAFLRVCADKSGSSIECPPWIGQTLFGHQDSPIAKRLPPAVERRELGETLFDAIPEFIPYIENLAEAKSCRVGVEALEDGISNVDLWGFFQFSTQYWKPHKEYFRSLFQPVPDLKLALDEGLASLRAKGKAIIGIHVRRGDFVTLPLAGFTLVVPSKWWCDWLDGIWSELEDPVLFLCSDDIDSVIHDFQRFSPVTSKDLNVRLPKELEDSNLEFYVDFFILSNCDVVGISNSVFSFTACMMNEHGKMFVRPSWDFSAKFTAFDPWNSEPLLYIGGDQPKFSKSLSDIFYTTYITQGVFGLLKCVCIYTPKSFTKHWLLRAYLSYQTKGAIGIFQILLSTLGLRFFSKSN